MAWKKEMMITLTAGVSSGEATYVGRQANDTLVIVTESALKAMELADYLEAISCIPELWDKEWDWEHPVDIGRK